MTVNTSLPIISFNTTAPAIYDSEDVWDLADLGACLQGEYLRLLGRGMMQRSSRTKLKPFDIFFASDFQLKPIVRKWGLEDKGNYHPFPQFRAMRR